MNQTHYVYVYWYYYQKIQRIVARLYTIVIIICIDCIVILFYFAKQILWQGCWWCHRANAYVFIVVNLYQTSLRLDMYYALVTHYKIIHSIINNIVL